MCALALVAAVLLPGAGPARADETSPANVAAARKHFEKARADYAQGAYREAITEFEAAHNLDPNAKDLVFNLGVVHEKLADIDDALKWFRLYLTMNLTPPERDRAEGYVRRLEGAKKEVGPKPDASGSGSAPPPPPPPPPPEAPPNGRIDAFTLGAAGVAAAGLVVGSVFGVKAISDKPGSGFVTGRNGSYQDLVNKTNQAHTEAVVSDVGFGVALAGAAATAYLYLSRPKDAPPPAPSGGSTSVSAAPIVGGGALFVQGSF